MVTTSASSDYGPVLHAYALVESISKPGKFYALHLENVIAEKAEVLKPNEACGAPGWACERIVSAIDTRQARKAWSKP